MDNQEVEKIAKLRRAVVEEHESLERGQNPSTAMMKSADVAAVYEHVIKALDDILRKYAKFV